MKTEANNILIFTEHRAAIDYLSVEDAGKLIKALFAYVDENKLPDFNGPMMSLFTVIRTQIDRSHEAYKAKCEKNSANAKKRFATHSASATVSSGIPSQANVNERIPPHTDASLPNPNRNPKPKPDIDDGANTHIINEDVVVEGEVYPFELSADEKRNIFNYVPLYVQSRPEKKYRKDFANFLTCRTWETAPINQLNTSNGSNTQYGTSSNGTRRAVALQNTKQLVSKFLTGEEDPVVSFSESEG